MDEVPLHWPKKDDKPFAQGIDGLDSVEAFVMPADDGLYTVGYQEAADRIVDSVKVDENLDALIFPVAYLYRHHLELMLKSLIELCERLGAFVHQEASPPEPCPACGHRKRADSWRSTHNLHCLWNIVRPVIETVEGDSDHADAKAVERVITQFNSLDRTGQAFRYARDKRGRGHLQGVPDRVDLAKLKRVVAAVSNYLDAAYAAIEAGDPGLPEARTRVSRASGVPGTPAIFSKRGESSRTHSHSSASRLVGIRSRSHAFAARHQPPASHTPASHSTPPADSAHTDSFSLHHDASESGPPT